MAPPDIPRREFIRRTGMAAAATLVAGRLGWAGTAGSGRVVHAVHGRAATWSRQSGNYYDAIDQGAVTAMVDQAVQALKGGTLDQAWNPVFALGSNATRRLAIKVNCNNASTADGAGTSIDAVPEPVIAVIRGFLRAGGTAANVSVYDLTTSGGLRYIPTWFRNRVWAAIPGVRFRDQAVNVGGAYAARTHVTWSSGYTPKPPVTRIHDLPRSVDYLVNVPIVKRHIGAGATLGYKNHFGSIENCGNLHDYVFQDVSGASVLADIMNSPYVPADPTVKSLAKKTVLTVGDMLYANPCKNYEAPTPWVTFANEWPNGLVVSDDPVAADCVMLDLLEPEPASTGCGEVTTWTRRYLQIAEQKGQGVYDHIALPAGQHFNPLLLAAYTKIQYRYLELFAGGALLTARRLADGSVRLDWQHYFAGPCEVQRATRPDFSDAVPIATNSLGYYVDTAHVAPAFYRVVYAG